MCLVLLSPSDHCFIHKWLLLTDPNDTAAGAKVCVCVCVGGGKCGCACVTHIRTSDAVFIFVSASSSSHSCLPQGYLKFSIQVIGPGDEPKPSPSEMSSESVDIEG